MRRVTWILLVSLAAFVPATDEVRAAPSLAGGVAVTVHPACRSAHGARIADHRRRIEAVRGEMGTNETALAATRDPAEIGARLATRADLRRRLARLEADRPAVERRSLALMKICARAAARAEPKRIVRHCRHVTAGSRLACR